MSVDQCEIFEKAQKFYVSSGYGELPKPLTSSSLEKSDFADFYPKFADAYQYYADGGFPDFLILSHMGGIDFDFPVELVKIPADQKHIQFQVPWGDKGGYYSTSENSPEMLGISSKGITYNSGVVLPHLKEARDKAHKEYREGLTKTVSGNKSSPMDYDQMFPATMKDPSDIAKKVKKSITNKRTVTYQTSEKTKALKSTSKAIKDSWSVPGQTIHCQGKGMQLFVNPNENSKMQKINYGSHDKEQIARYDNTKKPGR